MTSIRTKFLVLIVLICWLGIALTTGMEYFNFRAGFLNYLNTQQLARMTTVANFLGTYYEEVGSWGDVLDEPDGWEQVLNIFEQPQADILLQRESNPELAGINFPVRPMLDMSLFDPKGDLLVGDITTLNMDDLMSVKVMANGVHVGTLISLRQPVVRGEIEQNFNRAHRQRSVFIFLITLAITVPFALMGARRFSSQIAVFAGGMRSLTEGHYETQIDENVATAREFLRLVRDFNKLSRTLEANREAHNRWIADVSHELRTPISSLAGEIEALIDGVRKPDQKQLESLAAEVSRLQRLIEDLYALSRSDVGDLNYRKESLNLADLVAFRLDAFSDRILKAGLKLDMDLPEEPLTVNGDPVRLEQLLDNLLENSCRYTSEGGVLKVSLFREDDNAVLRIDDSAPGVPTTALTRLTERLFRIEQSRCREFGGSGLGLSISQNIVAAHDGKLTFSHSDLGGLSAEVRLPLEES